MQKLFVNKTKKEGHRKKKSPKMSLFIQNGKFCHPNIWMETWINRMNFNSVDSLTPWTSTKNNLHSFWGFSPNSKLKKTTSNKPVLRHVTVATSSLSCTWFSQEIQGPNGEAEGTWASALPDTSVNSRTILNITGTPLVDYVTVCASTGQQTYCKKKSKWREKNKKHLKWNIQIIS